MDGNAAAAHIAYRTNEVCAIYPITPASVMAELVDVWTAQGLRNLWGAVPVVQQMQSEAGAAGAVHGALQSGALTATFTASQGLLLMLPNMYKIAGELTPSVFYVAARSIATQALSIFGDHSDVMSARGTGFGMLAAASVQEAHDLALVAQAATLEGRIPLLFFFDGFRTSHEENKISVIPDAQIRAMIDDELVRAHRARALSPEHPVVRGTAHNPDTFFQARETVNPYYARMPTVVQGAMDRFAALTGRRYALFRYHGHPEAERVAVCMGSGFEVLDETAAWLNRNGERVGVLQVTLYRPWSAEHFLAALPASVKTIAVLDRCKESGATGEPLYVDVLTTLAQGLADGTRKAMPRVIGGRYGLSSKDFNPAMAKAVFDELARPAPRNGFTVGIVDDVSHTSLEFDPGFDIEPPEVVRALFYGLGADGTVGANKNSVKILAGDEGRYAQGYFVYDSKKSGSYTISHLRFGPTRIRAPYLLETANFVGVHKFDFLFRYDVLASAAPGATVLLNSPYGADEVWDRLPARAQAPDPRARPEAARDRREPGRARPRPGQPHQHPPANVFFRALGRAAARRGDRAHQDRDRDHLRAQGRRGGEEELPGDRQRARQPGRGRAAQARPARPCAAARGAGRRARVRAHGHRADDAGARRQPSGEPAAGRRHLPQRHHEVRKAQRGGRSAGVGTRPVHPVRPVRGGLPAQRDPRQDLRPGAARGRARGLQGRRNQRARLPRFALHAAGLRRGLHRLRGVRRELPGARHRGRAARDQHASAARGA